MTTVQKRSIRTDIDLDAESGIPLAYAITLDNDIHLYHSGDTSLFTDMKLQGELCGPTIGSLAIATPQSVISPATPGTKLLTDLSPREGGMAAQWLGLKTVLPCRYTDPESPLVGELLAEMDKVKARGAAVPKTLVMNPGEWIEIGADGSVRLVDQ